MDTPFSVDPVSTTLTFGTNLPGKIVGDVISELSSWDRVRKRQDTPMMTPSIIARRTNIARNRSSNPRPFRMDAAKTGKLGWRRFWRSCHSPPARVYLLCFGKCCISTSSILLLVEGTTLGDAGADDLSVILSDGMGNGLRNNVWGVHYVWTCTHWIMPLITILRLRAKIIVNRISGWIWILAPPPVNIR